MIRIIVSGKELSIEKGTSIHFELNNSIFSTTDIDGEYAYEFDVPAKENDAVFNCARFVYVNRKKRYDCQISIGSSSIGSGYLYIMKATKTKYSCAVTINVFPAGWSEQAIRDNNYGEDIIISDNSMYHRQNCLQFLKNTLEDQSIIKFPIFMDDTYYEDNNDFGFFGGNETYPIGHVYGYTPLSKFVNRLSFYLNGTEKVVTDRALLNDHQHSVHRGWSIFNDAQTVSEFDAANNTVERIERNQYSFAPAFRLNYLLEKAIENAGMKLKGNYLNDSDTRNILYQSLKSLDNNNTVYTDSSFSNLSCNESIATFDKGALNYGVNPVPIVLTTQTDNCISLYGSTPYGQFRPLYPGLYKFEIEISFNNTQLGLEVVNGANKYNVISISIAKKDNTLTSLFGISNNNTSLHPIYSDEAGHVDRDGVLMHKFGYYRGQQICARSCELSIDTSGNTATIKHQFSVTINQQDVGSNYRIILSKVKLADVEAWINQNPNEMDGTIYAGFGDPVYGYCQLGCDIHFDPTFSVDNIFTNRIHIADFMPAMTNADLLKTVRNLYGLTLFINGQTQEIEMSFIKDILKANAIDISQYELDDETIIDKYEDRYYVYHLKPLNSPPINEYRKLSSVIFTGQLPEAFFNINNIALVYNQNKYFTSKKTEDAVENWKYVWESCGGNDEKLIVGEKDDNNTNDTIEPDCSIPEMDFMIPWEFPQQTVTCGDGVTNTTHQLYSRPFNFPIISARCNSFLNDGDNNLSLILLKYQGAIEIPYHYEYVLGAGGNATVNFKNFLNAPRYYEFASPVSYSRVDQRLPGYDLTATGEYSIGENYIKPWIDFLSRYEKITKKFYLPVAKLMEVIELFRPQTGEPQNQKRFVFVDNTKYLPIKITFDVKQSNSNVLVEMELARERVDI